MSIHDRVRNATMRALNDRTDHRITRCMTCNGQRLVIQISPEMHDAWAVEATGLTGHPISELRHFLCIPVQQLPHLPTGTVQVVSCWDCTKLPTFPDDPDALARFLS